MTTNNCYFDFIYEPITGYRMLIFEKIISKVTGKKILDLGCGQIGHYWALGYSSKVELIDFFDLKEENITALSKEISILNPDLIEENFFDTVEFLKNHLIINRNLTSKDLALSIISKTRNITNFNFLSSSTNQKYDTILAIECIECVNTKAEFILALNNISRLLGKNSKLLCLILRYDEQTDETLRQVELRMEGLLNPNQKLVEEMFSASKLKLNWIESCKEINLYNYSEGIFLEAELKSFKP